MGKRDDLKDTEFNNSGESNKNNNLIPVIPLLIDKNIGLLKQLNK